MVDQSIEFSQLLQSAERIQREGESLWQYRLYENWRQGRATFGGLLAALCYDGVLRDNENLPPLRSASVNFIGPADEYLQVRTRVLRRGKSVAYIQAELLSGQDLVCQMVLCFGEPRESRLDESFATAVYTDPESAKSLEDCTPFVPQRDEFESQEQFLAISKMLPQFVCNFDVRIADGQRPYTGGDKPVIQLWIKHKDAAANDLTALIAMADMPPPAVVPTFKSFAPISTMNWMFNILTTDLSNESGWWLMTVNAEHAADGYSSQNMTIHNDRGELVWVARQNVAIFY